jgi:hypothetical protein
MNLRTASRAIPRMRKCGPVEVVSVRLLGDGIRAIEGVGQDPLPRPRLVGESRRRGRSPELVAGRTGLDPLPHGPGLPPEVIEHHTARSPSAWTSCTTRCRRSRRALSAVGSSTRRGGPPRTRLTPAARGLRLPASWHSVTSMRSYPHSSWCPRTGYRPPGFYRIAQTCFGKELGRRGPSPRSAVGPLSPTGSPPSGFLSHLRDPLR